MNRSKKKEQKRREEYKKAVEHKMKSAANLANKYSSSYELSSKEKSSISRRNKRIVNKKLIFVLLGILLQTLALICVMSLAFVPFKGSIDSFIEGYLSTEQPKFSTATLEQIFIGSENETQHVHYTDVEMPELNVFYATIGNDEFSSKIYYGISDDALLDGVAQLSSTNLPGFGKPVMLYGYSFTHFAYLENISAGDLIKITTNYGVYKYEVKEISTFTSSEEPPYDLSAEKETLILCTDSPFGEYKKSQGETFCVIADLVSGPEIVY